MTLSAAFSPAFGLALPIFLDISEMLFDLRKEHPMLGWRHYALYISIMPFISYECRACRI